MNPKPLKEIINSMKKEVNKYKDTTGIANQTDPHWRLIKAICLYYYIKPNLDHMIKRDYTHFHYHEFGTDTGFVKINNILYPDTSIIPLIITAQLSKTRENFVFTSVNYYSDKFENLDELERRLWFFRQTPITEINFHEKSFSEFLDWFDKKRKQPYYSKNNVHLIFLDFEVSWKNLSNLLKCGGMDVILRLPNYKPEEYCKNIRELSLSSKNLDTGSISINYKSNYNLLCITRNLKTLETFLSIKEQLKKFDTMMKQFNYTF